MDHSLFTRSGRFNSFSTERQLGLSGARGFASGGSLLGEWQQGIAAPGPRGSRYAIVVPRPGLGH